MLSENVIIIHFLLFTTLHNMDYSLIFTLSDEVVDYFRKDYKK